MKDSFNQTKYILILVLLFFQIAFGQNNDSNAPNIEKTNDWSIDGYIVFLIITLCAIVLMGSMSTRKS